MSLTSVLAIVPVTVMQNSARQAETDIPYHPTYTGTVFFRNTFDGRLPATDYPKVNVRANADMLCPRLTSIAQVLLLHVSRVHSGSCRLGLALLQEFA